MLESQEDVFYNLTMLNENYEHPPMPEGAAEGMYLLRAADPKAPCARNCRIGVTA